MLFVFKLLLLFFFYIISITDGKEKKNYNLDISKKCFMCNIQYIDNILWKKKKRKKNINNIK